MENKRDLVNRVDLLLNESRYSRFCGPVRSIVTETRNSPIVRRLCFDLFAEKRSFSPRCLCVRVFSRKDLRKKRRDRSARLAGRGAMNSSVANVLRALGVRERVRVLPHSTRYRVTIRLTRNRMDSRPRGARVDPVSPIARVEFTEERTLVVRPARRPPQSVNREIGGRSKAEIATRSIARPRDRFDRRRAVGSKIGMIRLQGEVKEGGGGGGEEDSCRVLIIVRRSRGMR